VGAVVLREEEGREGEVMMIGVGGERVWVRPVHVAFFFWVSSSSPSSVRHGNETRPRVRELRARGKHNTSKTTRLANYSLPPSSFSLPLLQGCFDL